MAVARIDQTNRCQYPLRMRDALFRLERIGVGKQPCVSMCVCAMQPASWALYGVAHSLRTGGRTSLVGFPRSASGVEIWNYRHDPSGTRGKKKKKEKERKRRQK
ncbi:hypothetical protein CGRA01v4_00403 [Colletotrichum graminicola]|nr:hypothetical protein CGRA01v4_00403 [Colletotrichum graminicola]